MPGLPTLLSLDATEVSLEAELLKGVCNVKCIAAKNQEQVSMSCVLNEGGSLSPSTLATLPVSALHSQPPCLPCSART